MMQEREMFENPPNSFPIFFSNPDSPDTQFSHSSVDCTLSLATPSTRRSDSVDFNAARHQRRSAGSYVSNFCWDLLRPKHKTAGSTAGPTGDNGAGNAVSGDPLLARRCANCDTTSTPLWRNGPRGPKSLCNACGIRFKKEERRAAAATVSGNYRNSTWFPINKELKLIEEHNSTTQQYESSISFLSWRLNVTDCHGLVHDFTR